MKLDSFVSFGKLVEKFGKNVMIKIDYDSFFEMATGHPPYDYQKRLACGERTDRPEAKWLAGGTTCHSQIIDIPACLCRQSRIAFAKD